MAPSRWGRAFLLLALGVGAGTPAALRADGPRPTLYTFDLRTTSTLSNAKRWDIYHASVCLQGLVNREAPRVLLLDSDYEATWRSRLTEPGGLCEGWPMQSVATFADLLGLFRQYVRGVILYDPDPDTGVISTSLAATTAAGVEDGLAIRKDTGFNSLYNYLVTDPAGPKLPVLLDLTGRFTGSGTIWQTTLPSSGSRKCDAYLWAKVRYLDTGMCDPTVVSDSLDLWGLKYNDRVPALSNLDFAVAARGFCMELSPWDDEVPNDDPTQPLGTDLNTYKTILNACNQQTRQTAMIKFCGFPFFPYKYSTEVGGLHHPVALEWETARLITAYNAYMEVFWTYNTSFYAALRPAMAQRHFVQNPAPTYDQMVARGLINAAGQVVPGNYVLVNLGDYDCVSWTLNDVAVTRYADAARGQTACNWAIDPNLAWRIAPALDYMYRHKTGKDFFAAWDSGAGYINPTMLYGARSPSGYPSGVAVWQKHCREWYRLLDYSISAWLLNGAQGATTSTDFANYQPFSGDGIGVYGSIDMTLYNNTPVKNAGRDLTDPNSPVIDNASGVNFAWYRTVLWTPTQVKQLEDNWSNSGHNHRFLDAFTFYYLMRHYLGGNNNHRATWMTDTIPRLMAAGQTCPVTVTVRNDGWDTWSTASQYRLSHAFVPAGDGADKSLVVDNDGLHGVQERSGSVRWTAGKHPIEITFFEKTGGQVLEVRYEGPGLAKQLIPNSALFRRSAPTTNGLDYAYYHGTWDNLPNFDALTPVKTGVLSNVSLTPATQGDYFGFRYTGYLQVAVDGIYTFYTNSDDGSRLYIGGADFSPRHALPVASVAPGQSVTFSLNVTAPAAAGRYDLHYDMVHDGVTWFRAANNIEGRKEIIVAANVNDVDTDGDALSDVWEEASGSLYWHPDDARFFQAGNPSPTHGAVNVARDADLSWTAAPSVTSHRVHFGQASLPPLVAEQSAATWDPGPLAWGQTYYWRIDEVSALGTATGQTWTFTIRPLPGDFDLDGDVDQADFGHLQTCFSGPVQSYAPGCDDADLDFDGDVDLSDFQQFAACLSGDHQPPGC